MSPTELPVVITVPFTGSTKSGHRASDEGVCQLIQRYFMSDPDLPYNYSKHMLYITKGDTCSIGIVITCPQEYYRNYCTRLVGVVCGPCAIIAIVF